MNMYVALLTESVVGDKYQYVSCCMTMLYIVIDQGEMTSW